MIYFKGFYNSIPIKYFVLEILFEIHFAFEFRNSLVQNIRKFFLFGISVKLLLGNKKVFVTYLKYIFE